MAKTKKKTAAEILLPETPVTVGIPAAAAPLPTTTKKNKKKKPII